MSTAATTATSTRPSRRRALALAAAALVAVAGVGLAAPATAPAVLLGKPAGAPNPNCPRACNVLASVTGFQVRNGAVRNPFIARRDGYIVAWKVKLGRPSEEARSFFNSTFNTPNLGGPTAQISILHRVEPGRFRLLRSSPNVGLTSYYGRSATITLKRPLRIRKGQVAALTTRTWVPNLVTANRVRNSQWRASRRRGRCAPRFATEAVPHRRQGTIRPYGCAFGDRLAYWAYLARD